jgi:hypothetical protein
MNKITELLHQLQQKRVPITAIEEIARRPGPNRDEIQSLSEREAG